MIRKKLNMIYLFVIAIIVSFTSIGYSALSQSLRISGDVAYHYKNQKLYDVLKEAAQTGTYATTYTGSHQDSINGAGNKGIYHWYADNDTTATAILDMNNVIFGGFCWQMIRTTDTGGVKMIYNGVPSDGKCTATGTDQQIGTSAFNTDSNSPAHVGYMYNSSTLLTYKSGSATSGSLFGTDFTYSGGNYTLTNTSTTIDTTHHYTCNNTTGTCSTVRYYYNTTTYVEISGGRSIEEALEDMLNNDYVNATNSTIKTYIDGWYHNNMTSFTSKLEDTIFCNDRSIKSLGGWDPNGGSITESLLFKNYDVISDLSCSNETDKLSLSDYKAELTYPVGLMTSSEMNLLGNDILRKTGVVYWLLSPSSFANTSRSNSISVTGANTRTIGNMASGIRPAISLVPGIEYVSGTGTRNDPYVVSDERLLAPTFTDSDIVNGTKKVTINYPSGCGTTLTCKYVKDNGSEVTVTSSTVEVSFTSAGSLIATVSDGNATLSNEHLVTYNKLYVMSTGNDSTGLGSIAAPYATLNKAYEMAEYNSTIYVMNNITTTNTLDMNSNKKITITSCTKENNTSCPTSAANSVIRGSSLTSNVISEEYGTLTLETITIDGNNVESDSPMIYSEATTYLNSGTTLKNAINSSDGGAIYNDQGNLYINGATISNNSAAEGGGIGVSDNSTLTITSGTITGNTATTYYGGGIDNGGTLNISGGTIENNKALNGNGGGINNLTTGTATISQESSTIATSITSNKAILGGGISSAGTLSIKGGTINNNEATSSGGGVLTTSLGTLTMSGGTVSSNTAENYGGGIHVGKSLTLSGGTISSNTAGNSGGGIHNDGNFTMSGGSIIKNSTTYGGGISTGSASTTNISGGTIGGSTANKNTATGGGGGIYNYKTLNITGGNITYNTSDAAGGGIYSSNSGTVTLTSPGNVSYNTSATNGGGFYIPTGTFTMNSGTVNNNTATGGGGAIWSTYNDTSVTTTTIKGGTISNNIANGDAGGGAIGINNSSSNTSQVTLNIQGGTISNNTANYSSGTGGGISSFNNTKVAITGGTITTNTAKQYGGGMICRGVCTMSAGTISSNTVESSTLTTYGGGIMVASGGDLTLSGTAKITGNQAKITSSSTAVNSAGGGICAGDGSQLTISGGTISSNSVSNASTNSSATAQGGGVWCNKTCSMSSGTISSNTAEDYGGGVFIANSGTFKLSGGTIGGSSSTAGNTVTTGNGYGGGMYSVGTVTMTGGTIKYNTARTYGGGWFVASSTSTMSAGTISSNTATENLGGGIRVNGTLTLSGGTISSNTANTNGGGLSIHTSGTVNMSGGTITANSASNGGGLQNAGTFTMTGGTIGGTSASAGNKATSGVGGAINSSGTITINQASGKTVSIRYNSSTSGGGAIYNNGGTANLTKGTINNNTGTVGGGVYAADNTSSVTKIQGITISNNTASTYSGGGVYAYGTLNMTSGTISSNTAKTYGGGVMCKTTCSLTGGSISSNTATTNNGGGLQIDGTATIGGTMDISGNTCGATTRDDDMSSSGTLVDSKASLTTIRANAYRIKSVKASKSLDVYNATNANGTNVHIYQDNNESNAQKWYFYPNYTTNGKIYYAIKTGVGDRYLEVEGAASSMTSGSNVDIWSWTGPAYDNVWFLEKYSSGVYYIKNYIPYCVDVYDGGTANGTNVWVYTCQTESANQVAQRWKISAYS